MMMAGLAACSQEAKQQTQEAASAVASDANAAASEAKDAAADAKDVAEKAVSDVKDAAADAKASADKGIIVGKNGEMLKRIGSYARADIERMLEKKVNLQIWVKVRKNWLDNDLFLNRFKKK